jgi:hypothetical protein
MKVLRWILDRWYLPLIAVAVVLGWWLTRGRIGPSPRILKLELDAIAEAARVREATAKLGAEQARRDVEQKHAVALASLNDDQRAEVVTLRSDPAALAKFLVKVAR